MADEEKREIYIHECEFYECGYPVGEPPFPECCTLIYGSKCQMDIAKEETARLIKEGKL